VRVLRSQQISAKRFKPKAMTTEEKIIFSVQIDQSDSIDKIARLTKDINGLKEANQKLALQQGDNTKAIAENNLLIQQATNERNKEQKAVLASMEAYGKEAKSIDDARAAVKQLTIERNKLDLSTTEGKKKQTELNASIDAHNKFIKENVDAYQQQKINIGNYTSALSGIKGPIGDFTNKLVGVKEGLTKTKDGLQTAGVGLSSLDGVIKASALGLLITIVGGLVAAFSKFEPLVEKVEFVMAGVNAAVDVLVSRFIDVGKAIMSLDFSNILLNFDNLGTAISDAAQEGYRIAEMFDKIEEAQTDGVITQSKYERAVASLNVELKNKTKTQSELLAISDKIAALDKAEIDRKLRIADMEVKAIAATNVAKIKAQTINEEDRKKFVEAFAKREEIQQQYEVATERRENRVDAINQKAEAKRQANAAEQEKRNAKTAADEQKLLDALLAADKKYVEHIDDNEKRIIKQREEAFNKANDLLKQSFTRAETIRTEELTKGLLTQEQFDAQQLAAKQMNLEAQIEIERTYYKNTEDSELQLAQTKHAINKKSTEDKQKFAKADIQSSIAVSQAAQGVISELASSAKQGSDLQKALALTNVAINLGTAIGNLTATTSAPSPDNLVTGGVAGFIKYAAGLTQIIAAITSATNIIGGAAAGGGDFVTSKPTLLLVGDNPGGRERVTVEPLSGRGKTTVNPNSGLIAMAGGGTITTTGYGGFADRANAAKGIIDYSELADAMANMPSPVVLVSDVNKAQAKQTYVKSKTSL
jgi:hypothetical protein